MSETNTPSASPTRLPRWALLFGGVALAGVGLAAGLMLRTSTPTAEVAPTAAPSASSALVQSPTSTHTPAAERTHASICANCGVVETVRAVQREGKGTGLGVVAGGVVGGVVGNSMGGGQGKTAMTVLGAIGGGVAGNEIEKKARSETAYEVRVRMDDGSLRTMTQHASVAAGTRVQIDGHTLHVIGAGNNSNGGARVVRTSEGT